MSYAWTFLCCGISFGLGYRFKAQFEINQESEINSLKEQVNYLKQNARKKLEEADYQNYLLEQKNQSLVNQLNNFKEQAKKDALFKIIKEEEQNFNPSFNFLNRL